MEIALRKFLLDHSLRVIVLGKQEKWKIRQKWRENFATEVKRQTGKWIINDIDWHAFSYHYTSCLTGANANMVFNQVMIGQFYCISSNNRIPPYLCIGSALPKAESFASFLSKAPEVYDLYISPPDFEWTMVFVHETSLGPFFAKTSGT